MKITNYVCPHCKKTLNKIVEWHNIPTAFIYDLKTCEAEWKNTLENKHIAYICPECEGVLEGELFEKIGNIISEYL